MCGKNKERATSLVAVPYYSGIGLILSPIVGTYYELWGLPLILNFIVCGMALLTFFRQYGHSGSTGKQRRHRKQTECYCSANTALQAFKRI